MKRFIEGEDRAQITLLPECLDDYVAEDNPVRVVEVFVGKRQSMATRTSSSTTSGPTSQ
jgi:transposase